jgi:hypothetical protein
VSLLLKDLGLGNSIKIEDEDGELQEVPFSDLSIEEQYEVLKTNANEYDLGLDEGQKGLIDFLKTNHLSVEEYNNYVINEAIKKYESQQIINESLDSLTDEEVFILDLKNRFTSLTDDEVLQALDIEKQNDTLFAKKVESIRVDIAEKERLFQENRLEQ